jgi:hypothetical protein
MIILVAENSFDQVAGKANLITPLEGSKPFLKLVGFEANGYLADYLHVLEGFQGLHYLLLPEVNELSDLLLEFEGHGVVEFSDHVGHVLPLRLALGLELKVEAVLADRAGTPTRPLVDVIWLQIEKAVPVSFLEALVKVF